MLIKGLITAAAALAFSMAGPAAYASELHFQIAGPPVSAVNAVVTSCIGSGTCSVSTTLDPNLGSQSFSLAQGQSDTFNFFNVAVNGGFDTGTVDVTADLGFILPESVVVSGTGTGEYFTFFGIVSGGMLTWAEPDPVLLSDGSGFSVNLSDIRAFGFGNSAEVTATVVADLVVAPEPATLPLLGIGLFAVAVLAWRRRGTVRA